MTLTIELREEHDLAPDWISCPRRRSIRRLPRREKRDGKPGFMIRVVLDSTARRMLNVIQSGPPAFPKNSPYAD